MSSGIYQIRNRVNGKRYIGSSVNLRKRRRNHLSSLRLGQHPNPHLQAAFDKYGEVAFAFEVLECATAENLIECEQYYLNTLKPEYNIAPMAGSLLGFHPTDETRRRLSAAGIGRRHSDEARRRISETHSGKHHYCYGKHLSEETRHKISEAWTPERRRKISEAMKGEQHPRFGKHLSEETKRKLSVRNKRAMLGKHHSAKTRAKMSAIGMGHPVSAETRRKISEAQRGKHLSEETCSK